MSTRGICDNNTFLLELLHVDLSIVTQEEIVKERLLVY